MFVLHVPPICKLLEDKNVFFPTVVVNSRHGAQQNSTHSMCLANAADVCSSTRMRVQESTRVSNCNSDVTMAKLRLREQSFGILSGSV